MKNSISAPLTPAVLHILLALSTQERHGYGIMKEVESDSQGKVKMGPLLARGAAALALGALNPLLAFIPFVETGPGKDSDCAQLLAQVKAAGVKEVKKK